MISQHYNLSHPCYPFSHLLQICRSVVPHTTNLLPTTYPNVSYLLQTCCSITSHTTNLLPTTDRVLTSLQCAHLPTGSVHSLQCAPLPTVCSPPDSVLTSLQFSPPYGALTSLRCAHLPTVRSPPYSVLTSLQCAHLSTMCSPPYRQHAHLSHES